MDVLQWNEITNFLPATWLQRIEDEQHKKKEKTIHKQQKPEKRGSKRMKIEERKKFHNSITKSMGSRKNERERRINV